MIARDPVIAVIGGLCLGHNRLVVAGAHDSKELRSLHDFLCGRKFSLEHERENPAFRVVFEAVP